LALRPLPRLAGLRSEISISRSRLHPLSPLGRGQGEGSWTLDWTLSQ